jgi:pimeloyl-ACP methyl ester carboxylesterase
MGDDSTAPRHQPGEVARTRRLVEGHGGVRLVLDESASPNGSARPPVVLLHGGAQTRHAWKGTTDALVAARHHVLAPDLRGHGESEHSAAGDYSIEALVEDLHAVLGLVDGPAVLVGASLGGLISMCFAAAHPALVRALVLVDVVARNHPAGEERIRRFLASHLDGFESMDEVVDAVADYQPHRPRPADASGLEPYVRPGVDGRLYWHWDPAFLLAGNRSWTFGKLEDLEHAGRSVRCPTHVLVGGDSDVVDGTAVARFRELIPHVEVSVVERAHHMIAGDQNDEFSGALLRVLERLDGGGG